ncbi:MAG: ATP-dependent DNA ligase, partial [Pseudomonadota bacterium]|nr:ATP-dependent DNA ligase [Pseudomonadota bacterium]
DAAWAVYVLIGRRLKRSVGPALLRTWLFEEAGLPQWLVDETYASVGDLAETIALLVPAGKTQADQQPTDLPLSQWFLERILPLAGQTAAEKRAHIVGWWHGLAYRECFLVNKLLTGGLRVGVSRSLVTRALAECLDQPRVQIERALIGNWEPSASFWSALTLNQGNLHVAHPYPFFLASPLEAPLASLGERGAWLVEWKWDGIRGQIVRRDGRATLWSRGEEVITDRFPEIIAAAQALPDGTVIDGEVLAWQRGVALPFARLQQRIGRSKLSAKILEDIPARFIAYDLLESGGADLRPHTLRERRGRLEALVPAGQSSVIGTSPALGEETWEALGAARDQARSRGVEGLMLKAWNSPYGSGRQRGAWWKWKVDPFVFDGVLLYAAPGHGRRSNLYTDYTFGVWHEGSLVPVAKAYSGLTDAEIRALDRWIRINTKERFGIVRSVEPAQVFELAYEGIAASSRHKSGIALRFPRMLRWRADKPAREAGTLGELREVLNQVLGDA